MKHSDKCYQECARYYYSSKDIVIIGVYEEPHNIKICKGEYYEVRELKDYNNDEAIYGDKLENELRWIRVPTYEECYKYYVRNK